jgi:hypothetical protein
MGVAPGAGGRPALRQVRARKVLRSQPHSTSPGSSRPDSRVVDKQPVAATSTSVGSGQGSGARARRFQVQPLELLRAHRRSAVLEGGGLGHGGHGVPQWSVRRSRCRSAAQVPPGLEGQKRAAGSVRALGPGPRQSTDCREQSVGDGQPGQGAQGVLLCGARQSSRLRCAGRRHRGCRDLGPWDPPCGASPGLNRMPGTLTSAPGRLRAPQ